MCEASPEDQLFPFRVGPWFWLSPEADTTEQSESSCRRVPPLRWVRGRFEDAVVQRAGGVG